MCNVAGTRARRGCQVGFTLCLSHICRGYGKRLGAYFITEIKFCSCLPIIINSVYVKMNQAVQSFDFKSKMLGNSIIAAVNVKLMPKM